MTLPNFLTMSRIVFLPFFIALYLYDFKVMATLLLIGINVTDWLDGYIARRWNQESAFGAFLDPVADKITVASALILVVYGHAYIYIVVPVIIIICREIAISALREWMAERQLRANVAVSWLGKIKTTLQMVGMTGLIFSQHEGFTFAGGIEIYWISVGILYLSVVMTVWSMLDYFKGAIEATKQAQT